MSTLPPLVEPAEPLTADEFARYSRHVLLPELGETGQRRLKAAKVLIIGAGGLGAPSLQYLAAAGVGHIGVIDDDLVDETNLQRQVIHRTQDIGIAKVESAARAIADLNPLVTVSTYSYRLTPENAQELFSQYDLILDGADNFPTRYLVSDAAESANVPVLWASVLGFDAQISLFWAAPPTGQGITLRDVFPTPPAPGLVPSCSQAGVVGAMVGQVGSLMGAEAVKLITGIGTSLLGRIIVFNQLKTSWTTIPLQPRSVSSTPPETPPQAPPTPVVNPSISYVDLPVEGSALVDVREADEVAAGYIPGAIHIPLALILTERGRTQLDPSIPVVIYCQQGPRAERAAQELTTQGFKVDVLLGGYSKWESEKPSATKGSEL